MSLEGQQIGRYRLLHLLGSGGMGEVYLAEDTPINRQVAIKVIKAEVTPYPNGSAVKEAARLFQREVKAIAMLDHPRILPLFDYGEQILNATPITYLVMPYRPEGSLTLWLRQHSGLEAPQASSPTKEVLLQASDIAHFIHQAADALQHAHEHQIIHQDVKPANFLIRNNSENPNRPDLLLADFGVAKFSTGTSSASQSIRGTPTYMAPEQLDGHPVPASDQYALAIMAYELLTGRPPFQGSLSQVMYQHFQAQPQPPSTLNPRLPVELDAVILHALAKKSQDRFPSIQAFANAFQKAIQSTDGATAATTLSPQNTPSSSDQKAMQSTNAATVATTASPYNTPSSSDIRATLAISDVEALSGTSRTLTLPGGQQVSISVPAGAYDGQVLYLKNQVASSSQDGQMGTVILTLAITPTQQHAALARADLDQSPVSDASTVISSQNRVSSSDRHSTTSSPGDSMPIRTRRGPFGNKAPLLIGLAILVILMSIGALLLVTRPSGPSTGSVPLGQPTQATTNATAQASPATVATQTNANPNPSPTAPTQPTSPPVTSSNPYAPHTGTLALNDPLSDNSKGYQWEEGQRSFGHCAFSGGAYHSYQPQAGYFHSCTAYNTDFNNFAFEVQMTMISGDYAGIIFCKATPNTYYFFDIGNDGTYTLSRNIDANIADAVQLVKGSVALNQANLIAVVVHGGIIDLYLNRELLTSVNDSNYTHGQIAVLTGNDTHSAETAFSNAKVWTL